MERIFFVENGDLFEVNQMLQRGGRVKSVHAVAERVSAYGYAGGETYNHENGFYIGDIYAYIVVEYD